MAGRFYRIGEKFFSLSINTWRRRQKNRYRLFYLQPPEDNRNTLARWLDHYGLLILAMLLIYLIMLQAAGPVAALLLSLPIYFALIYLALKLIKARQKAAMAHERVWKAANLCRERLTRLGSAAELFSVARELLVKLEAFKGSRFRKIPPAVNHHILLHRVTSYGLPVVVGVMSMTEEDKNITVSSVQDFIADIKRLGYKNAIILTNGIFSEDARLFAAGQHGQINLRLLDVMKMVDLARTVGHRFFSLDEKSFMDLKKSGSVSERSPILKILLSGGRKRSYKYLATALVIAAMSVLTGVSGPLLYGYHLLALLNLFLFIMLYYSRDGIIGEQLDSYRPV